jgi:DNA polymerase-3 subunit alpha
MQYIPVYAIRKPGKEQVVFADERLKPITAPTHGICIYQEQYMRLAKELAGFSPAEAETLRKAIGKKIHSLMASLKDQFLAGCAENGVAPAVAQQLWKDMESSQDYSFNKAHAACYALIAYRTAWLKANHAKEYMAALISSVMNTKDRVPFYVNACRELGIDVLPPDVNSSQQDFAVVGGVIHFGLNAVKNVGEAAADAIVRIRAEGGTFESIWELTERVDPQVLNTRALESLVKCGALASTGATRMGMLTALEAALGHGQRVSADRLAGQASIFDGAFGDEEESVDVKHPPLATTEFDERELLRLEKETLGLYVSEHPLERVRAELKRKTDCALTDLERRRDGEFVTVGGIVSGLKQVTTKRGEPMVFVTLDDPTGSAEVVVFNSTYAAARELLEPDRVLVVKGRVDHKQAGETKLVASEVSAFEVALVRREVRLRIDARQAPAGLIRELATLVADFPGDAPVYLALETSVGERTLALGPEYRVKPEADFFAEVRALLGEAAVA